MRDVTTFIRRKGMLEHLICDGFQDNTIVRDSKKKHHFNIIWIEKILLCNYCGDIHDMVNEIFGLEVWEKLR